MKTRCALCADKLVADADGWRHGFDTGSTGDGHDPLTDCPRCGKSLDNGSPFAMTGRDIPHAPYFVFGVAFWVCLRCGGVWHRWGTDTINGTSRRWGPDDERRQKVEHYFKTCAGQPDGEGVKMP